MILEYKYYMNFITLDEFLHGNLKGQSRVVASTAGTGESTPSKDTKRGFGTGWGKCFKKRENVSFPLHMHILFFNADFLPAFLYAIPMIPKVIFVSFSSSLFEPVLKIKSSKLCCIIRRVANCQFFYSEQNFQTDFMPRKLRNSQQL